MQVGCFVVFNLKKDLQIMTTNVLPKLNIVLMSYGPLSHKRNKKKIMQFHAGILEASRCKR